ncbi:MAPEG family protein [Bradyrhizobium sp. 26S5]|uniref:MAPEG family protein n=1 Tax=Bradyrhizobium sp. 26S5 TaxID=3139729 RepID=UPI0030CE62F0
MANKGKRSVMPLPIALVFAGTLGLLNLWLAYRCVQVRLKGPGGVGDLGIAILRARMRAHANFVEYTPFVLILMALIEYAGGSSRVLEAVGIVYVLARIVHALGIERPKFTMQFIGALGTWIVSLALAIWALWIAANASTLIVH